MKLHPLRLSDPNDELGAMMYPSLPQEITHQIDHHSALAPRMMPLVVRDQGLMLRSVDSATCSREEISCPVCGEVSEWRFVRLDRFVRHSEPGFSFLRIVLCEGLWNIQATDETHQIRSNGGEKR